MNMKKFFIKSKLTFRIVILIVSVCLMFGVLSVYISTNLYSTRLIDNYTDFGNKVANVVSKFFPNGTIEEYSDIVYKYNRSQIDNSKVSGVINSKKYQYIWHQINELRESLKFNDVYVCVIDLDVLDSYDSNTTNSSDCKPLYYIADTHVDDKLRQPFAKNDSFSEKYIQSIKESVKTGQKPNTNYPENSIYGYTITCNERVFANENFITLVCCDIKVESYQKDIINFVGITAISVFAMMLILIFVSLFVVSRRFIGPVVSIANEAENFAGNEGWNLSTLEVFNTGDEIELLAKSILKMQKNMFEYMDDSINKAINLKKVRTELNLAKSIQADMLPSIFPESTKRNSFDLDASMTPAKEVGGDFYDFFFIDDNHLALVIADVSGKGVPAALFMVITKTLIKDRANINIPGEDYSPAEILKYVNEQLCENNKNELFVTVWLAIIDMQTGEAVSANAGHEYPTICRKGEKYELIKDKHSPAVATIEGIKFKDQEFKLNPGDSLFVYTDGVTEATNAGGELFGEQRLIDTLNRDAKASASDVLKHVSEDVNEFVGNAPQFDDLTMVCFKYYGKGGCGERDRCGS